MFIVTWYKKGTDPERVAEGSRGILFSHSFRIRNHFPLHFLGYIFEDSTVLLRDTDLIVRFADTIMIK
jgi:hypothetical protein